MVGRWSEAATLKFVYFYKLHECLWNTRSEFYNVKDARNAAYADLVLQMRMPDFDVRAAKVKIKNLRAHYFTELKKVRYAAAMGDRYEPTLYWFKEMDSFLRDTIGDIPSLHQPEVITADSIYDSSSIYESGFGDDEDSMEKPTPFLHISETRSLAPPRKNNKNNSNNINTSASGGRGGGAPFHRRVTSSSSYRPGPASSKRRKKQKEAILGEEYADEFEAFGRSVSAQLRKLSLSRALRAQSKIQAILTEERIHDLETTTAAPPPSLPLPLQLPPPPAVDPRLLPPAAAVLPTSPHDLSFGLGVGGTSSTTSLVTNTTDSGVDSGIDTTTSSSSSSSSSAASSVAGGLPSPTTPTSIDSSSMPLGGITTTESTTTSSTSTSTSSSSSSCIKELKEFRKSVPEPTPTPTPPPTSDVIIKAECELITLDEDDPFEGH